jgi:2-polyprenyl-6-methoxyphenol hydroxylase-like FAD-dependent oxidoreductase
LHNIDVKVAVIGNGPAGSAVALMIAKSGLSVALCGDTDYKGLKIGECLSARVKPILIQLGLWEQFVIDLHMPSYGNRSS